MAKYYFDKYNVAQSGGYYSDSAPWVNVNSDKFYFGGGHTTSYSHNSISNTYSTSGSAMGRTIGSVGYNGSGNSITRFQITALPKGEASDYTAYITSKESWQNAFIPNYIRGTLVQSNIVAEDGVYPTNGRHSDGFWYVRGALTNVIPTLSLTTSDNRTLYESDTFNIIGSATDSDAGNVVSVKYQVNEGTIRAISTGISTGASIPFSKTLTYKAGALYDGSTIVSAALAENANHTLKVWAEDDQGGKSAVQTRTFKVVANRPPLITFNPFSSPTGLINSDNITVSGTVNDPDGNTVSVKFKIGNGSYTDVYSGAGGTFSFDVNLALLSDGPNAITVQAVDSYGALTQKALNIAKTANTQPLKTSVTRYKLTPPNASAKGVLLWVERDAEDVLVTAEISMTAAGVAELFVPMTKSMTAYVADGIEEDEFTYEASEPKQNIVIKLTQTRTNTATNNGITLISGVLS